MKKIKNGLIKGIGTILTVIILAFSAYGAIAIFEKFKNKKETISETPIQQVENYVAEKLTSSPLEDPKADMLISINKKMANNVAITKQEFYDYWTLSVYKLEKAKSSEERRIILAEFNQFVLNKRAVNVDGEFLFFNFLTFDEKAFVLTNCEEAMFIINNGYPKREENVREMFDIAEKLIREFAHQNEEAKTLKLGTKNVKN